jgi:hypothetical protein
MPFYIHTIGVSTKKTVQKHIEEIELARTREPDPAFDKIAEIIAKGTPPGWLPRGLQGFYFMCRISDKSPAKAHQRKAETRSNELYRACDEFWAALGGSHLPDIEDWRHTIETLPDKFRTGMRYCWSKAENGEWSWAPGGDAGKEHPTNIALS